MKNLKILRNRKILALFCGLIFGILVLNTALADVSVSSIITDKQNYNVGDVVEIKFNISVTDEGACALDSVNFSITDGGSLSCSLPIIFGNYSDYNCNGQSINLTLTQTYHDCNQYGGNNNYSYDIYWQIPNDWNVGKYYIKVNMSAVGKSASNTVYFNVNKILNSNISNSTIEGSYVENSTVIDSTVNGSNVTNSNIIDSNIIDSTIMYSSPPPGARIINATITHNILNKGTILLATPWGCCKDCKIFKVSVNNSGTYVNDKYVSMNSDNVNVSDLRCLCFKACANYCGCYANISIVKTPNVTALSGSGYITYTYNVTNNGCINLTDLIIKDNKLGTICNIPNLASGSSYSCSATAFLNANTTNEACVNAALQNENAGIFRCTEAQVTVSAAPVPVITLSKTASSYSLSAGGGSVTYYYNVENTGNVPLSNVNVSDDKCSNVVCPKSNLSIGESMSCNCTKTLTSTETNIATVKAMFGGTSYEFGIPGKSGANVTVNVGTGVIPTGGGVCTTCGPQPYGGIPVGQVTTTQQISTTIPDTTTPGSHCFKIECTTNTHQDGKLTTSSTKNVPVAADILLTLPDGKDVIIHTNANGEICYNFGCGIYKITVPKNVCGEEYSRTITTTYGKLHITPSDLIKAKINETLTYIIKDNSGNVVKGAKVSIGLPDGNVAKTSDYNGKVTFNVGEKEGSYTLKASKDCYENDTLTGTIVMPKLVIKCDSEVNVNETLCCYVKDQDGNNVGDANVKLTIPSEEISLISDASGKVCTNETQFAGDVTAIASKEGYKDSNIATGKIIKEEIVCDTAICPCGCIEGTTRCKPCPECNIFGLPCWILLLLLVALIIIGLLFLMKKRKFYADNKFIEKAIRDGKIEDVIEKYKKIYVSGETYKQIQLAIGDKKVETSFGIADINEKGEKIMEECNDKDVALAKQLNAVLLTHNENKVNIAKKYNLKTSP